VALPPSLVRAGDGVARGDGGAQRSITSNRFAVIRCTRGSAPWRWNSLSSRYYHPAPRELGTGALRPSSRARRAAETAWQRLPLPVTALASKLIFRYL